VFHKLAVLKSRKKLNNKKPWAKRNAFIATKDTNFFFFKKINNKKYTENFKNDSDCLYAFLIK
jgi:hypothetical protein